MQQTDGSVGPAEGLSSPGGRRVWRFWPDVIAHGNDSGERDGSIGFVDSDNTSRGSQSSKVCSPTRRRMDVGDRRQHCREGRAGGHDRMLVGWPWAEGTHSWVEPTALAVLALRPPARRPSARAKPCGCSSTGCFPDGGCNYGNTVVLGQTLRPHVQPTGLALLALAGEGDRGGRSRRVRSTICSGASVTGHDRRLAGLRPCWPDGARRRDADGDRLARARPHRHAWPRDRSPYKLALLALARADGAADMTIEPRNHDQTSTPTASAQAPPARPPHAGSSAAARRWRGLFGRRRRSRRWLRQRRSRCSSPAISATTGRSCRRFATACWRPVCEPADDSRQARAAQAEPGRADRDCRRT